MITPLPERHNSFLSVAEALRYDYQSNGNTTRKDFELAMYPAIAPSPRTGFCPCGTMIMVGEQAYIISEGTHDGHDPFVVRCLKCHNQSVEKEEAMKKQGITFTNYKGHELIVLPTGKRGFQFGRRKANLFIVWLTEIASFVEDPSVAPSNGCKVEEYKGNPILSIPQAHSTRPVKFDIGKARAILEYAEEIAAFANETDEKVGYTDASPKTQAPAPTADKVCPDCKFAMSNPRTCPKCKRDLCGLEFQSAEDIPEVNGMCDTCWSAYNTFTPTNRNGTKKPKTIGEPGETVKDRLGERTSRRIGYTIRIIPKGTHKMSTEKRKPAATPKPSSQHPTPSKLYTSRPPRPEELDEIESILDDMRQLEKKLDEKQLPGRHKIYTAIYSVESGVGQSLIEQWIRENYPYLDYDRYPTNIINEMKHGRTSDQWRKSYELAIERLKKEAPADNESARHREIGYLSRIRTGKDKRLVADGNLAEALSVGQTAIKISMNMFRYTSGEFDPNHYRKGLRALCEVVVEACGGPAQDIKHELPKFGEYDGGKITISPAGPVTAIQFYKNGHAKVWFKTAKQQLQVIARLLEYRRTMPEQWQ